MTFRDAISDRILRAIRKKGYTYQETALAAGLAPRTVARVVRGESMGANAIEKISFVLDIEWEFK